MTFDFLPALPLRRDAVHGQKIFESQLVAGTVHNERKELDAPAAKAEVAPVSRAA
jgi:hypothetical protein